MNNIREIKKFVILRTIGSNNIRRHYIHGEIDDGTKIKSITTSEIISISIDRTKIRTRNSTYLINQ